MANQKKNDVSSLFMPDGKEIMVANILHIIRQEHEFEDEAMLRRCDGSTVSFHLVKERRCPLRTIKL